MKEDRGTLARYPMDRAFETLEEAENALDGSAKHLKRLKGALEKSSDVDFKTKIRQS